MATHSSSLAWKIPWTEEPGRLQSMGFQRVGHDWSHLAWHAPGVSGDFQHFSLSTQGSFQHVDPPSMGFSRQDYWSGLPFSSPGDLPDPGIEPESTGVIGRRFTVSATREGPSRCPLTSHLD